MKLLIDASGDAYQVGGDLTEEDKQEIADGSLQAFEFRPLESSFFKAEAETLDAEKEGEEDVLDLQWFKVDSR